MLYVAAKEGDESLLIVPLPNVCDCTLRKVLQYCIQHTESGTNLPGRIDVSETSRKDMEVWDRNYMLVSNFAHSTMPLHSADLSPLHSLQETLRRSVCTCEVTSPLSITVPVCGR